MYSKTYIADEIIKAPTEIEIKEFSIIFNKEQWEKLCKIKEFSDNLFENLNICKKIAEKELKIKL